jgi:hypothetical protein
MTSNPQKGFATIAIVILAIIIIVGTVVGYEYSVKSRAPSPTPTVSPTSSPTPSSIPTLNIKPRASVSTTPNNSASLWGHATIGPFCPVEKLNSPCPVPSGAYDSLGIMATGMDSEPNGPRGFTTKIDSQGNYSLELPIGTYIIELMSPSSVEHSKDLPKTITLSANQTLRLDISIDTGIR